MQDLAGYILLIYAYKYIYSGSEGVILKCIKLTYLMRIILLNVTSIGLVIRSPMVPVVLHKHYFRMWVPDVIKIQAYNQYSIFGWTFLMYLGLSQFKSKVIWNGILPIRKWVGVACGNTRIKDANTCRILSDKYINFFIINNNIRNIYIF